MTTVTKNRLPILAENASILLKGITNLRELLDFNLIAYAILPDHMHLLIKGSGNDLSSIMKRIKLSFSKSYRNVRGIDKGHIWQHRYWDHIIRDQEDLNNHIDYIHYNPVKHGLADRPFNWRISSIHEYREYYPDDWGVKERPDFKGDFGE